jgi:hypothetical protein
MGTAPAPCNLAHRSIAPPSDATLYGPMPDPLSPVAGAAARLLLAAVLLAGLWLGVWWALAS